MKEIKVSIWDRQWDGYWRVIPINTVVKANGELVMGAGLAKQARDRYENLDELWGSFYASKPRSQLVLFGAKLLIGFPTKVYWKSDSSLELIDNGLKELLSIRFAEEKIASPRLGCGFGGLNWEQDVKPLVEKYFGDDDNFVVVSL